MAGLLTFCILTPKSEAHPDGFLANFGEDEPPAFDVGFEYWLDGVPPGSPLSSRPWMGSVVVQGKVWSLFRQVSDS